MMMIVVLEVCSGGIVYGLVLEYVDGASSNVRVVVRVPGSVLWTM